MILNMRSLKRRRLRGYFVGAFAILALAMGVFCLLLLYIAGAVLDAPLIFACASTAVSCFWFGFTTLTVIDVIDRCSFGEACPADFIVLPEPPWDDETRAKVARGDVKCSTCILRSKEV